MSAPDHVGEELFGAGQASLLFSEVVELLVQHPCAVGRPTMEHLPDLRQAHTDALTGAHHLDASEVLVGVPPVARRGPVGHHDTLGVPMPQDVLGDSDMLGELPDPHPYSLAA